MKHLNYKQTDRATKLQNKNEKQKHFEMREAEKTFQKESTCTMCYYFVSMVCAGAKTVFSSLLVLIFYFETALKNRLINDME